MMNIGDKVVCVDDVFSVDAKTRSSALPKKGQVYVVRGIRHPVGAGWPGSAPFGVYIVGITHALDEASGNEIGLDPRRFRLLAEVRAERSLKAQCPDGAPR